MKKTTVWLIVAILVAVIPIAGATKALLKRSVAINCDNPEFAEYVSAYTDGMLSKHSSIKIRLAEGFADNLSEGEVNADVFEFSPGIDGVCKKIDSRTIEFVPNKPLESGEDYIGILKLDRIANVKDHLKNFIFGFSVVEQNLKVQIDEQVTTDRKTLKTIKVNGTVKTSDTESPESIKKCVSAFVNGNKVDINWLTDREGKAFLFSVDNIERGESLGHLVIKYDGDEINSESEGEISSEIQPLNVFKITKLDVVKGSEQRVELTFSDPLKEKQNLDGLVSLSNDDGVISCKTKCEGNRIILFPDNNVKGVAKLSVFSGIQNILNTKYSDEKVFKIEFTAPDPEIRTVRNGVILPDSDNGLIYPFEAVNLKAVDVTIVKVLEQNILEFIKNGSLNNTYTYNLKSVGVPVYRSTIHLANANEDLSSWKRYSLDLSKLIQAERGAIYSIKISFRKSHLAVCDSCDDVDPVDDEKDLALKDVKWSPDEYESDWDYCNSGEGSRWDHEDDPCYKAYYNPDRYISQNILASNIGIICKKDLKNNVKVYVTDLKSAKPVSGAKVEIYGYQQQVLATKSTNKSGEADFSEIKNAYFAIAKNGKDRAYISLNDGSSLSLSRFDVSGTRMADGLKDYIYGERGVWRPGDTVHLTCVIKEDPEFVVPEGHPIVFQVKNPDYQIIEKRTLTKNPQNFYVIDFATQPDARTGIYEASVTCGDARFEKNVRIETVKPNRLKIDVKFNKDPLTKSGNRITINSRWLHGASAKGLKVVSEYSAKYMPLTFDNWKGYTFDNDNYELDYEPTTVYEGNLDQNGSVSFEPDMDYNENAPSQFKAVFTTRVFENGGNFSTDEVTVKCRPYDSYVGVCLENEKDGTVETDADQTVAVAVVDANGKALEKAHKIEMKFYKMRWSWWWEDGNYQSENYDTLLKTETKFITGKGNFSIRVNYPEWGRYKVKLTDVNTGVSTTRVFYMDWPESRGRNPQKGQGATTVLLTTDKAKYNIGETVKLTIPTPENGRALVSIESGTKTISSEWINTQKGETQYTFTAKESMEPGVYAFVTIVQPHSQTINDMPIRMYGVLPINIENPATKLTPVISMSDNLEAETDVKITVSEQDNKPMTYTLAVVDDGLLDLTRFKTPNPWDAFYAREALGVKTWDIFDNVIGAYGGKIERIFSVGGDESNQMLNPKKANNLQSVAIFLGPFTISGGSKTHTVKLPKYFGSVRTMVVAGNGKAFGNAEKTSTVTKPLMVFATAPRVLGPNEKFKLPVSVFTGDNSIKNVNLSIKTFKGLKALESTKTLTFTEKGEQMPTFDLETLSENGFATFEITATSGSHKSVMNLVVEIREPNAPATKTITKAVNPGETTEITFTPIGKAGTNTAALNISSIMPLNFSNRLQYLIGYPYGCMEQTVSKAFPQLFLADMTDLSADDKARAEDNVKKAIEKIYKQQVSSGGFSYWPNEHYPDLWVTSYAGNFLVEAQKKGFAVDADVLKKWKNFEKDQAQNWYASNAESFLIQAYRLYALAVAGEPLTSAMNRLKENANLSNHAKYHLAAAYAVAGKASTAKEILAKQFKTERSFSYTVSYYSAIKERAIMLQTYCETNQQEKAFATAKQIADYVNSDQWMSTQTAAFSLVALSQYFNKFKPSADIACSYTYNGKTVNATNNRAFYTGALNVDGTQPKTVKFKNSGNSVVYVELTNTGVPANGTELPESSNLTAKVQFKSGDDAIDPARIKQGTDFDAIISITNTSEYSVEDLALTNIFPSGWEILDVISNEFYDSDGDQTYYGDNVRYTDKRDDRVYTFFKLQPGHTLRCRIRLNAAYLGEFYLPGVYCESQYDHDYYVKTKGKKVVVAQ